MKTEIMRKTIYIIITILLLVIGGFSLFGNKETIEQGKVYSTYALTTAVIDTLPVIAWKRGLWNTDTVIFEGKNFVTGRESAEALISGNVDFASMASLPFLLASKNNPNLKVLAVFSTANSVGIIANKNNGINSVEDLRGKKIAMTAGTTGQFYIDTFMLDHGFSEEDFETINLSPAAMLAALERGDVDAITTWEPHIQTAKNLLEGSSLEIEGSRQHKPVIFIVATREDVIKEKPEAVIALIEGLHKSENFIKDNQGEVQDIMVSHSNISKDDLKNMWKYFDFSLKIDSELITLWQEEQLWGINRNFIEGNPRTEIELSSLINDTFLKSFKPERVAY